ncbi:hypothetical protein [Chitinophaga filiformis]|uniref:Lipocalin-like domain-containing protein n=1 Tax=Chitinophaga filiformis TaxID=104663 RepID=A0A1G7VDR5_CHIFI|nr:hypothetical protein [Chitinophaga filiformis]SDG57873.1 hypothetical protein SAMN04488121_10577 [Chitinophaga filiformis]
MKRISSLLLVFILTCTYSAYAQKKTTPTFREGTHNFTLQWISWDKPGKVQIRKKNKSTYTIKGEQRDAQSKSFVTIDGTLKVVSSSELVFTGTIKSLYESINEGNVCERTGTYHFLAKGARKYWRLQEMENCEGNNVTDYIDIYFN